MVLGYAERGSQCKKCYRIYRTGDDKWCKPCQIDFLKANFKNWTSGNETIDHYIQEMQLKFYKYPDIVFEWIQYNQFNDIKEIDKGSFFTVHSAIWMDGPLYYHRYDQEYKRRQNQK